MIQFTTPKGFVCSSLFKTGHTISVGYHKGKRATVKTKVLLDIHKRYYGLRETGSEYTSTTWLNWLRIKTAVGILLARRRVRRLLRQQNVFTCYYHTPCISHGHSSLLRRDAVCWVGQRLPTCGGISLLGLIDHEDEGTTSHRNQCNRPGSVVQISDQATKKMRR